MIRLVLLAVLATALGALTWHCVRVIRQRKRQEEFEQESVRDILRRDQAFERQPGSTPGHPIRISSPAVVEIRAESLRCPRCSGTFRAAEHRVETIEQSHLRVAHVICDQCGSQRDLYFSLQH